MPDLIVNGSADVQYHALHGYFVFDLNKMYF